MPLETTMNRNDWLTHLGKPYPDDNNTPHITPKLQQRAAEAGDLAQITYLACTHDNRLSRHILDGVDERCPYIGTVVECAAEEIQGSMLRDLAEDEGIYQPGRPAYFHKMLYYWQSARTVWYWADRNRRLAKALEQTLDELFEAHGVNEEKFTELGAHAANQAVAAAVKALPQQPPKRLHPQSLAALAVAAELCQLDMENARQPDAAFDAGRHTHLARTYLMARALAGWGQQAAGKCFREMAKPPEQKTSDAW